MAKSHPSSTQAQQHRFVRMLPPPQADQLTRDSLPPMSRNPAQIRQVSAIGSQSELI